MIRKIEKTDRELFLRLTREFYASPAVLHPVPDSYHTAVFEEMMRSDLYAEGYFLEYDGIPSGYALLAKTYSHEAGGLVVWIEEIYTVPEMRGKGLGREFFAFLERQYGASAMRLRLETEPENKKAEALYKKLGFQELGYRQFVKERQQTV
mgnify:FL=1